MGSIKKTARTAGVLYLLLAITGMISLMVVPSMLITFGNATETAASIQSSELLFRIGIVTGLLSNIIFVLLALVFYQLFRKTCQQQATLLVVLVLISATAGIANETNQLAALLMLSGADFLSVFDGEQLDALAYALLRLHSHGLQSLQVFWGLWLFPLGLLCYRSGFIPKVFGVLLFIAGVGYIMDFAAAMLFPLTRETVSMITLPMTICELPIVFWLLFIGAREPAGAPAS